MICAPRAFDIPEILGIWNPIIRDTALTFTDIEKAHEDIARLLADRPRGFLVAEEAGRLFGFATFGVFRAGPGYARTFGHTILLASEMRGRGIGRASLFARNRGKARGRTPDDRGDFGREPTRHRLPRGARLRQGGRISEAGRKFGRWLDPVLMAKAL